MRVRLRAYRGLPALREVPCGAVGGGAAATGFLQGGRRPGDTGWGICASVPRLPDRAWADEGATPSVVEVGPGVGSSRRRRTAAPSQVPGDAAAADGRPPIAPTNVDLDVLQDLASFYVRSVNLLLSRDLDHSMRALPVARGTGKISTLLIVGTNPGIRPSTVAHVIMKDRSAMNRLLGQLKTAGLLVQRVSASERRAHELYLTEKGEALARRVRAIARAQNKRFFSVLSAEEQGQLRSLLRRVYGHYRDAPRPDSR